jgi:hypothetical protein
MERRTLPDHPALSSGETVLLASGGRAYYATATANPIGKSA